MPKKNQRPGAGWGRRAAFEEGRGGGESGWGHTPWAAALLGTPPPLPRASPAQPYSHRNGGEPARSVSLPFPAPSPPGPRYLSEPEIKVAQRGFPRGRASPGGRAAPRHPAAPPRSTEQLLVGVFRAQAVGPLVWAPGSRRQPLAATRRAPRLHGAGGGLAPRQARRAESASRGAGRTMEPGAGPAGAPRPRRARANRPAVAAAEPAAEVGARPLEGGVSLPRFRPAGFVSSPPSSRC